MRKFLLLFALSLSTLLCGAQTQNADLLPEIQDTFFGLRLGTVQSLESIRKALPCKEDDIKENVWGIAVQNVKFAGNTWDVVNFYMTDDGVLFQVSLFMIIDDSFSSLLSEQDKSQTEYERLKQRLDNKYGEGETGKLGAGQCTRYFGRNNIGAMITRCNWDLDDDLTKIYHHIVTLTYTMIDYLLEQQKRMDDEL